NILMKIKTLKINIKLHGYNMLYGSEIIAIIHHVHYKTTNSIYPKSLVNLTKGETTIMKCAPNNSNILIPKKIKWSDINIPEDWSIQSDTIAPNQNPQDSQNDSQNMNEPISPTYSEMKPHSQLMTIIIDESFEINKDLIRKDFLQEKYLRKRNRFFTKYSETEQNNIRTTWYEYMIKIKAHVMFFDYLKIYINQQENKKYFEEENKILEKENKHSSTNQIPDNKII
ncbi:hypothetical protein CFOL_v3_07905, partial [Cephalotus follicularis]